MTRVLALALLLASPTPAPVRLLALGDSFTAGTGSPPGADFPARLAERWRARGRGAELLNLAVNGYSTDEVLARELPRVRAFAPTRVTLAVGANDLVRHPGLPRYREQLRRIFAGLREAGVPGERVWVLPQPDWARHPAGAAFGDAAALEAEIARYNAALHEEATAAGATWVDLGPLMERQAKAGQVAEDGLHPSADAYAAWAEALAAREP